MAFFGLTTLGASEPVKEGTKVSQEYQFHNIPEEAYQELFQRHVLGDSDVAQVLQVDGAQHILRAKLGDMLKVGWPNLACMRGVCSQALALVGLLHAQWRSVTVIMLGSLMMASVIARNHCQLQLGCMTGWP